MNWSAEVHTIGCKLGTSNLRAAEKQRNARVARVERWYAKACEQGRAVPPGVKAKYETDLAGAHAMRPIVFVPLRTPAKKTR
jgi:hypothetical protein